MKPVSRNLLTAIMLVFSCTVFSQKNPDFDEWLAALREESVSRGFSEQSIALAFSEIEAPIPRVVSNDRNQAEFVQTYDDYLGRRVSDWKRTNGRQRMLDLSEPLAAIQAQYGIPPQYLVAIWGMETNFGTFPITNPLFNVLATLAFDPRRASLFRAQFFAALTMLDSGFPPYEKMTSSMAGALGQSQFLPENYLRFAVDFDGDGKRDIWDTDTDALASIANYFASFGWTAGEIWGRKVQLPASLDAGNASGETELMPAARCRPYSALRPWRDLQDWQALGVRREDGSDLPDVSIPAALISADEGDGQGYLVYRNFCTLMRFNPAFKYALSIGLLADAIKP